MRFKERRFEIADLIGRRFVNRRSLIYNSNSAQTGA